jgi:hypothetical protein
MNAAMRVLVRALMLTLLVPAALAGPGHDHGDGGHDHGEDAAAASGGSASPRFAAQSELFEAVGVLQGGELSVFVDRYDDNAPVVDATVELESGEFKASGTLHEDHGDYSFPGAPFEKPGRYPIVLTITAGEDVDLLAGILVVPAPETAHEGWLASIAALARYAGIAVALVGIALLAAFVVRRRRRGVAAGI